MNGDTENARLLARVAELEKALDVVRHFKLMWVALPEDVQVLSDAHQGIKPKKRWWQR